MLLYRALLCPFSFFLVVVVSGELGRNTKLSLPPVFSLAVLGTFRGLSETGKKQFCCS